MEINQEHIRNFVIISHINHGKSTLADRFLELTETVPKEKMRSQYLDQMDLEREKGITIKMQPVRMIYKINSQVYLLNLIDTPGHVDFSYEVSRALAAVEGAILLVDATQGIQAQTLANLELAKKQKLVIVPVVNKIDLANARIEETSQEIAHFLEIDPKEVMKISAKYGTNVKELLLTIVKKIPPPKGDFQKPFRSLIFDSKYDPFKGVIAFVRVIDGEIGIHDHFFLLQSKAQGKVKEIGFFGPQLTPDLKLRAGQIGYLATGLKEISEVRVGDTITKIIPGKKENLISNLEPLPGYQEPRSMVFVSIYPENQENFDSLKEAINKLKLNDPAFTVDSERKEILGQGFRCGFLGNLHAEIIIERLRREFSQKLIISLPQVVYKIIDKKGRENLIYSLSDWPTISEIKEIQEPWVRGEIITPYIYLGEIFKLINYFQSKFIEKRFLGKEKILLICEFPLREIITGFYDLLKSKSQGFASMNYDLLGFRPADLVKLEVLVAGKKEEAFSKIVARDKIFQEGRKIVTKLKEILPPQQFPLAIQAAVSGKIVARETIKALRRDVTAPLYGGDYTRKRKLLERQKRGKKELKEKAKIKIPTKVFLEFFRG